MRMWAVGWGGWRRGWWVGESNWNDVLLGHSEIHWHLTGAAAESWGEGLLTKSHIITCTRRRSFKIKSSGTNGQTILRFEKHLKLYYLLIDIARFERGSFCTDIYFPYYYDYCLVGLFLPKHFWIQFQEGVLLIVTYKIKFNLILSSNISSIWYLETEMAMAIYRRTVGPAIVVGMSLDGWRWWVVDSAFCWLGDVARGRKNLNKVPITIFNPWKVITRNLSCDSILYMGSLSVSVSRSVSRSMRSAWEYSKRTTIFRKCSTIATGLKAIKLAKQNEMEHDIL